MKHDHYMRHLTLQSTLFAVNFLPVCDRTAKQLISNLYPLTSNL